MADVALSKTAFAVVAAAVLGGCNSIFGVDGLSYDAPAEVPSSGSGGDAAGGFGGFGTGGDGGVASTTTTSGTGGATTSGAGGGESLTPIVRYFLDEEPSGVVAGVVVDSGQAPALDLSAEGPTGEMAFVEQDGNRGVSWASAGGNAGLRAPVDAKLLGALDGATSVTIEAVFTVEEVVPNGSRIVHIGPPVQFDSRLNLRIFPAGTMEVNLQDPAGVFPVPLGQRTVLHVAIDSTVSAQEDRVRVYVGGARVAPGTGGVTLPQGLTLAIPTSSIVNLGNRDCCRSPKGTIAFVALYDEALDERTIVERSTSLAIDDDGP